jgi:hypothetical protein
MRICFAVWACFEVACGIMAIFAREGGAAMIGWHPPAGWTSDLVAATQQYGLALFVLAAVYFIAATDPKRYSALAFVAIGEQAVRIGISALETWRVHISDLDAFLVQTALYLGVAAIFITVRAREGMRDAR